jgi:uncharacterized protein YbjT (DUF2867 family)
MNQDSPVLVLGATGKTGRRIAERLHDRGVAVRLGSRSARPAFDWTDQTSWAPALDGVASVYVSYYPDIAIPGAPELIEAFAKQALAGGVRRLVLLSGRGEYEAQRSEEALQASGADWTIVRCSWFAQNFSEGFLLEPILAGEVALPNSDVPEPFVDTEDIADVATAALTEPGHEGQVYELTGPRMLSFADAVGEIAAATGRSISFVPVSMRDYAAVLDEADLPEDVKWLVRYLFSEVLDGRNAHLTDGVQQALGRPATDFDEYVHRTAATGVWHVPGH